jgi:hypothetical protein
MVREKQMPKNSRRKQVYAMNVTRSVSRGGNRRCCQGLKQIYEGERSKGIAKKKIITMMHTTQELCSEPFISSKDK